MSYKCRIPQGVSGPWRIERFKVPKFSVEGLRCAMHGRPVRPGTYTRLLCGQGVFQDTVMSDTPAEVADMDPLLRAIARTDAKRVLINGLGLGICLDLALKCPTVQHVDVVEISTDVMALVAPHFGRYNRVKFHLADALDMTWPPGTRWDCVWHDIWTNMPNEDNVRQIQALRRKYRHRCRWQGVWCMDKVWQ